MSKCIVCGSERIFFEHLCQKCYLENHPILQKKKDLHIVACEKCELIFVKGHWTNFFLIDVGEPTFNDKISTLISQDWIFYYKPKRMDIGKTTFIYNENGLTSAIVGIVDIYTSPDPFVPVMSISEDFEIAIDWGVCSECRTRLSGTYSSKIQIRSPMKIDTSELEKWGDEIEELSKQFPLTDGKNPLFKIIHIKNGIDALFQTKAAANSIGRLFSKNYGGIVSVTTEFAGFDKSKWKEFPRKRVVLVSLPEFTLNDIVIFKDKPIQICQFKGSKVEFWDFTKKTKVKLDIKPFMEAKPKKIEEESQEFQIINFEQNENIAQVMNTKNYETYYINSNDIEELKEGEIFRGTFYDGKILVKQKFSKSKLSKDDVVS